MTESTTLAELVARGDGGAPAIRTPGRDALTYDALRALSQTTLGVLNAAGIGRNDRIAIVLPNGPEMATAFVSLAACATAAPLNPAYKTDEFEFYLSDLGTKAAIVLDGDESPVIEAAAKLNVPLIPLTADTDGPAGAFSLLPGGGAPAAAGGPAGPDDTALILHTSGTTSRPKIVPLSHRNVSASARNISNWLELDAAECCLNVMPLFHIHGLIAAVLSSLYAGASVACTPGFNALQFFSWVDEIKPSWYTAVPTMHQAILARAARNREILARNPLRLIRSSSSSLPGPVMTELEEVFGAPVIESYGMTEAAHQMASNPLPPRQRRPGCVGIAAGPEVAIMAPDGAVLAPGEIGEIVIRGDNVTSGYENNDKANAEAFTDGWFRTGDQGRLDAGGYLTLTGRLKEIINRGGEKISPREVDDVLMTHPAVSQAVVFAVPHAKLGEDVAAAIVLREGEAASERDIRDFAAERLAAFKVPRKIILTDEIPKGATGKLQRIGLAEKLGLVP